MTQHNIGKLRKYALSKTSALADGEGLAEGDRALIRLALTVSATCIDENEINAALATALDSGATIDQVQEIVALTSGLGVHSLMASETAILSAAQARGLIDQERPLDEDERALWNKHIGDDPFWEGFSRELPGFLDAMLRLSPAMFKAFFAYCAVPWQSGTVRARVKELAAMACDASPTHCFGPGFRVHLANAIMLGVGRRAVMETLDIAAAAPGHAGYRISP